MTTPTQAPESPDREIWIQARHDYKQAFAIAEAVWPKGTPPEVLQSATATLLIHHGKLKQQSLPHNRPTTDDPPVPGSVKVCPECDGEMWDNRGEKKNPRSPDLKCKDPACGHAIWLTPPPARKKAGAA